MNALHLQRKVNTWSTIDRHSNDVSTDIAVKTTYSKHDPIKLNKLISHDIYFYTMHKNTAKWMTAGG